MRTKQKPLRIAGCGRHGHIETEPCGPGVYIMEAEGSGLVKIGYSKDAPRRLRQLATGCPTRLRPLAHVEGDRKLEKQLHRRFSKSWSHGEWFRLTDEIRAFVADHRVDLARKGHLSGEHRRPLPEIQDSEFFSMDIRAYIRNAVDAFGRRVDNK